MCWDSVWIILSALERCRAPGPWQKGGYEWQDLCNMQIHRKSIFPTFAVHWQLATKASICLKRLYFCLLHWNENPQIQLKPSTPTKTPCRTHWEREGIAGALSAASAFGDYVSKTVDCYFWQDKMVLWLTAWKTESVTKKKTRNLHQQAKGSAQDLLFPDLCNPQDL